MTEPETGPRKMDAVDEAEALWLLSTTRYGRVVFTLDVLPAVRVVNHVVAGDEVLIRTSANSAVARGVPSGGQTVVVFQADDIDQGNRTGWSVSVVGYARVLTDPDEIAAYGELPEPWVSGDRDVLIAIRSQLISGFRLAEG